MKKILSVLILCLSASFAAADVEPIRFAPTRPAAPVDNAPAAPAVTPNATSKPDGKDAKAKKHTKSHHKKKASAPTQH